MVSFTLNDVTKIYNGKNPRMSEKYIIAVSLTLNYVVFNLLIIFSGDLSLKSIDISTYFIKNRNIKNVKFIAYIV